MNNQFIEIQYSSYIFDLDNNKSFFVDILNIAAKVKEIIQGAQKIVIDTDNEVYFIAAIIAVFSGKKELIILPNNRPGTLKEYKGEYDIVLSQEHFSRKGTYNWDGPRCDLDRESRIVMFTSGSQGKPKKVIKNLNLLITECDVLEKLFSAHCSKTTFISTVTHHHIYGVLFRILWPLLYNRPIANFNILYPEYLNLMAKRNENFTLISSPAFLKRLESDDVSSSIKAFIRNIFSSGGKLEQKDAIKVHQIFDIFPIEIYGSTETGGIGYRTQENENEYWEFFPDVKGSINSESCLNISSSYIIEDNFQSNDKVELIDSKNTFRLLGRIDRVYKIEEKRVSLDEIEARVKSLDDVHDAKCLVINRSNRQLLACVIEEKNSWKNRTKLHKIKEIKSELSAFFEPILLPRLFHFCEKMPYNEQSKLLYSELIRYFDEK